MTCLGRPERTRMTARTAAATLTYETKENRMKYSVHLVQTVSTTVEVEAESVDEALEKVYDSPDMPGSITYGAFGGSASVDEAGEWTPVEVYDTENSNKPVWKESP